MATIRTFAHLHILGSRASTEFPKLMSYFQAWKSAKFVFHWVNVGQTRTQNIRKVL